MYNIINYTLVNETYHVQNEGVNMLSNTQKNNEKLFSEWLSQQLPPHKLTEVFLCYPEIEKYGKRTKILKDDLFNTKEIGVIKKLRADIESNKAFRFQHKKQMKSISLALKLYVLFLEGLNNHPQLENKSMSEHKKKKYTIHESIVIVLKNDLLLTTKEIYEKIIQLNLYVFGAKKPEPVISTEINRSCRDSNYSKKQLTIDFGKRVCSDGVARYFLLSREGELPPINQVTNRNKDDELDLPYIRTSTDAEMMAMYPVLFKRIYAVMKEYGGISVSAQDIHVKIGKIARLSTIKIILNSASWCEHNNSLYKYSDSIITHDLPDEYNGESISSSREKEFYHWLETVKGMPSFDCSRFTSGINILSQSLKSVDPSVTNLYTINDFYEIEEYLDVLKNSIFETLTNNQRVRLKRSIELYIEYLKEKETKKCTVYSPKKSREKEFLLWANFQVGPEKTIAYSDTLKIIEERCISHGLIPKPFYELDNTFNSSKILNCVYKKKFPFALQTATLANAIEAIPLYDAYLHGDSKKSTKTTLPSEAKTLIFKRIGNLAYTKPVRFSCVDVESTNFDNWTDLYTKVIFLLRLKHPKILSDGTYLSKSMKADISSEYKKKRSPKLIGKNLYVETNLDTNDIVNRIATAYKQCGISLKKVEIQYVMKEKTISAKDKKQISIDSQILSKLIGFIKAADNGVSFSEIKSAFSKIKQSTVKSILTIEEIILINEKYYHISSIEDFDDAADVILDTIQAKFRKEQGYTSAKMLYNELHIKLEDFFFDNGGFDSQIEIYDIAKYLFEKTKYKGFGFVFADNKHIWESEPDYPKTYLGLLSHWAKLQNGIITRNEMLDCLEKIGSNNPSVAFSWLMLDDNQNPKEKVFLMYDEYRFVLADTCGIDEFFLSNIQSSLEELFDGDEYLSFDDISDYFYSTLPELPSGVYWSAHMIKSILKFYDLGFFTVAVGSGSDIKMQDAAIVKKNSIYKTFSDVLWSEINRDYELPREFSATEFRQILLHKGFIHGSEKLYSVHTTVEGDLRFLWTDNNKTVTVSKK